MAYYDIVAAVRTRIGDIIEAEVSGISEVYVRRPKNISPPNLPAMLITVDAGTYDNEFMDDIAAVSRVFHPILLAASWAEGIEFEVEERCEPFFEQMARAFARRDSLETTRGDMTTALQHVQDVKLTNDSGIVNVALAGKNYAGVIWDISTTLYIYKDRL